MSPDLWWLSDLRHTTLFPVSDDKYLLESADRCWLSDLRLTILLPAVDKRVSLSQLLLKDPERQLKCVAAAWPSGRRHQLQILKSQV